MAARFVISVLVLALCEVNIHARSVPTITPQPPYSRKSGPLVADKDATILEQSVDFNPEDNSYVYSFQTSNGITAKGHTKDGKLIVEGSYYINKPDGTPTLVQYLADEKGFQAYSDAIPTPHPDIVRIIEYLRTLPPPTEGQEELEKTL